MLDKLSSMEVVEVEALHLERSSDQRPWHVFLDAASLEAAGENGGHDFITLFSGEGGSHERVLQCFHDGGIEAVPCVVSFDMLGANGIAPFAGFGQEEFELGGFISIRLDHDTKEFLSFMGVQSRNGGSGSGIVVLREGQVTWEGDFGLVGPGVIAPFEVDKVPVALVESNGSTCGTKC